MKDGKRIDCLNAAKALLIASLMLMPVISGCIDNNKDSDGDGLSDKLEDKYGLDKHNPNDANEDWDNDLFTNIEEILNYTGAIHNPNLPISGYLNNDKDYVIRSIEIENGLNPDTKYSFGELHDFIRLYGYTEKIPNNVSFQDIKNNISNFEPRYWSIKDGGNEHYRTNIYSKLTLVDPIFQYYADQVHINWENDPTYGKVGQLKLDDENLFLEHGRYNNSKDLVPPSYYLTHGRKGNCVESSVANDCIFQHKEYPSTLVSLKGSLAVGEVKIGDTIYFVNYNKVIPREMLNPTYGESYDPNWLVNGTDRHM